MARRWLWLLLCGPSALAQVAPNDSVGSLFHAALQDARRHFAPDRRIAVFDLTWSRTNASVVVRGEVDRQDAKDSALALARLYFQSEPVDSIIALPHASLGEKTYGIVVLSAGNVRSKPGEPEELATQVTMGQVVRVLKKGPGYYYVQSHDGYLGWLDGDAFHQVDRAGVDDWASAKKCILTTYFEVVRERPTSSSDPVCDAIIGNIFRAGPRKRGWTEVTLADGRRGYLPSTSVQDHETWKQTRHLTAPNVERTARMFIGVPYLWGGTSSKGMDCSGFTKTVFRLNGLELNRDASQQVLNGQDIDSGPEFQNLAKGDLLFFGRKAENGRPERITHVAIYLGERRFIHSSGRIRLASFDPASPEYDEFNLKRFVRARRVIPGTTIPER
ncbi:MAG: C40 family peptidase [Bacteroidetes bacterium]|jgi:cell wall-associated NlpC family hydrolase|nr:C40 family peptidase [Bacteroidota bacterium]